MAFTQTATMYDGVRGAWVEFGTFTLDPASIAAAAQGAEAVTISGVATGDQVFVSGRDLEAMLAVAGAAVTDTDEVTVYLNNVYDATTAVDGGSKTYDIMIVHLS